LHHATETPLKSPSTSVESKSLERIRTPKKSIKEAPSIITEATIPKNKQFHVHIMEYNEVLKPTEVAKLLRLGNVIPLKTTRLANKTVYYTHAYGTIEEAKAALEICLQQGYSDAEIEVVY